MKKHPEDRIYDAKKFINELSKVQDRRFNKLVKKLGINKEAEYFLFDYIYNEQETELSFGEYLECRCGAKPLNVD
jgi:hypothetical protein